MLDPRDRIIKGGILALAALAVIRVVWHDFNKLMNDYGESAGIIKPVRTFSLRREMKWATLRLRRSSSP